MIAVRMFGETSVGVVRKSNQDSIFYDERSQTGVVADGIGGRKGGDLASGIVIQEFANFIQNNRARMTPAQAPDLYAVLLEEINNKIFSFGERHREMSGLGTTATAIQFVGQQVFIPHCGDSRAYLFMHDHLFQLTIDHNVASSIHHGWLDPTTLLPNIKKSVLTRGVGLARTIEIDIYRLAVATPQIFLLCSDGLSDMVNDRRILKILRNNKRDSHHLPSLLIKEACARGGRDNVTVLICEVSAA